MSTLQNDYELIGIEIDAGVAWATVGPTHCHPQDPLPIVLLDLDLDVQIGVHIARAR